MFFAISGFVIASDLIPRLQRSDNRQNHLNTTIAFWLRRFWRIIPSAWFWLAFILLATILLNDSSAWGVFRHNFETVIAAFLQVADLNFAMVFSEANPGAAFVYWSRSLEEQFYLLLAATLVLIASYDSDYIGAALGALKKPLLWTGSRSYAIYLIHIPAYLLTRKFWFHIEPGGTVFDSAYTLKYPATATVILLVLSELNYHLIETHWRRYCVKVAGRVSRRELLGSAPSG